MQDWVDTPQLCPVQAVAEIINFARLVMQYSVSVDTVALAKYELELRTVVEALERNNANGGGAFIVKDWQQTFIRSLGLLESIEDIENIIVKSEGGVPVLIKDIAIVEYGRQQRQGGVTR